jgi:ATP-dependent Clp protease ATP-binding subunit ClpX
MVIKNIIHCSFCNKSKNQVKKVIASKDAFICNECISLCNDVLEKEAKKSLDQSLETLPKPREIFTGLGEYVIGQDHAKKVLSVAVYNHYKRILANKTKREVEISKSNIMMIGSTGCGKTLLAEKLAKVLSVPFAIADATSLTEAGYVGDDVETILQKLLQAANFDVKKAEQGIIYLDEIDKIAKKSTSSSSGRDISGEGVQQNLLKLVEGTIASVPQNGGRKTNNQEYIKIDTSNILFIVGGAFEGLDKIIQARTEEKSLGLGADIQDSNNLSKGNLFRKVESEDLIKFGIIPEFLGRFPVITSLEDLDEAGLIRILTEPKNALVKQYQELFALDNLIFEVEEVALSLIAKEALTKKTGARALRTIMEKLLLDLMFEVHEQGVAKLVLVAEADKLLIKGYNTKGKLLESLENLPKEAVG